MAALAGRAREVLVRLMTQHRDVMETPEGVLFGLRLATKIELEARRSDTRISSGRIGKLNLSDGCFTVYEVFRLASEDIAQRGLAREVSALLRTRRQSVRQFLAERYGIDMGEREYWHDPRRTPDAADLRDFLRALRQAK